MRGCGSLLRVGEAFRLYAPERARILIPLSRDGEAFGFVKSLRQHNLATPNLAAARRVRLADVAPFCENRSLD